MASGLNVLFSVMLISNFVCSSVISDPPQGDVQTEIRVIKEELKGVKEVQEMERITIMGINQMVKSVDGRVTDAVKESTKISTKLDDLSKKEESHHSEVILQKEQIQNLQRNMEGLTKKLDELKQRGILDALHPTGSIYLTFSNIQPPMNGKYGIQWELLPEGYVLMTTNKKSVGSRSGVQRLDGGATQGHALSGSEMPSHGHGYWADWHESKYGRSNYDGSDTTWALAANPAANYHTTFSTGGNQPHSHTLDIKNQKVMVWKRTA